MLKDEREGHHVPCIHKNISSASVHRLRSWASLIRAGLIRGLEVMFFLQAPRILGRLAYTCTHIHHGYVCRVPNE